MAEQWVTPEEVKPCPYCGEMILAGRGSAGIAGEYLDPKLRAEAEVPDDFDRFVTPAGRPASAIAAGYLGLLSLLPFFGLLAIIVSLTAMRTLKREPHLLGRGRAWFGLVMGILMTLLYAIPIVMIIIEAFGASQGHRPRF